MQPLDNLPPAEALGLTGLLFDLDDTVLDHGRLATDTYRALGDLFEAGLCLVAVTGRPSSWGAVLARQWPVAGVITENGSIVHYDEEGRVLSADGVSAPERRARRQRLAEIVGALQAQIPELALTDDIEGRVSDATFDIGEFRRVPAPVVARAVELATELGARTLTSSVHLHVTLDGQDKASGAVRFLSNRFDLDPTACRSRFAFIGDSENDASCFAAFRTTIAVANFRGRPTVMPRYVTRGERGRGFVEAASALLRRFAHPGTSPSGLSVC